MGQGKVPQGRWKFQRDAREACRKKGNTWREGEQVDRVGKRRKAKKEQRKRGICPQGGL